MSTSPSSPSPASPPPTTSTTPASPDRTDGDRLSGRVFAVFNAVISVVALSALGWLLLLRQSDGESSIDIRFMPAVNATLNAIASGLLIAGWRAIRRNDWKRHRYYMIAAFGASALFLVGYVAYHYVHGDTRFVGPAGIRAVYLVILATHVLLSMALLPLVLTTFFFAFRRRFEAHRRIARITLPVWLYVSVTGVVIFVMLHGLGFNTGA